MRVKTLEAPRLGACALATAGVLPATCAMDDGLGPFFEMCKMFSVPWRTIQVFEEYDWEIYVM